MQPAVMYKASPRDLQDQNMGVTEGDFQLKKNFTFLRYPDCTAVRTGFIQPNQASM